MNKSIEQFLCVLFFFHMYLSYFLRLAVEMSVFVVLSAARFPVSFV